MTIREIYDWAKENNCLDVDVGKHYNMHFYEITSVTHMKDEIPGSFGQHYNLVVVD